MMLVSHFLLGFLVSFVGTIPPSMLNMTTVKISLEQNKNEGLKFALGVSIIIIFQSFLALYFAKYIHNNTTFEWYISILSILIFSLLSIYFFKQARTQKRKENVVKSRNNLLFGILLSSLNMFAIPFYCGVSSVLNMSGFINFELTNILSFILGSSIGTFSLLYFYIVNALKIKTKAGVLTKQLNYFLGFLTALVSIITILKVL